MIDYICKGPAFFEEVNNCEFPRVQTCPWCMDLEYRFPAHVNWYTWICVKLLKWISPHSASFLPAVQCIPSWIVCSCIHILIVQCVQDWKEGWSLLWRNLVMHSVIEIPWFASHTWASFQAPIWCKEVCKLGAILD